MLKSKFLVSTLTALSLTVSKTYMAKEFALQSTERKKAKKKKTDKKKHFAVLQEKIWDSVKYKVDVIILYDLCFSVCVNRNELEVVFMLSYTIPHIPLFSLHFIPARCHFSTLFSHFYLYPPILFLPLSRFSFPRIFIWSLLFLFPSLPPSPS